MTSVAEDWEVATHTPVTAPKRKKSTPAIDFDNGRSDLTIVVEDGVWATKLLVSSDAMRRASSVWETMLSGKFAETQEQPLTLDYTEDAREAVVIVMNIIHLRFSHVPATLNLVVLKDIAIFTDKFALTHIVAPWLSGWLSQLAWRIDTAEYQAEWLWIAWEYGLVDVFNRVGHRLASGDASTTPNQLNVGKDPHSIDIGLLPPGVEDNILQARNEMTNGMLTAVYGYLDALLQDATQPQSTSGKVQGRSKCKNSYTDCIHLQLGSLIHALQLLNLWPRKTAKKVDMLPSQLRTKLLAIQLSDCLNNTLSSKTHQTGLFGQSLRTTCGDFGLVQKEIESVLSETESFATDEVLNHLKLQMDKASVKIKLVPQTALTKWDSLRFDRR